MDEGFRESMRTTAPQCRALYAAAVIGLISFVALALLFPAPIHSYRARAVLEQTALVGRETPLELELLIQPQVEQLAQEAFPTLADQAQLTSSFSAAVACQVERPTPQQVRITFETHDRYADRSLELCRGLADDLLARAEKSFVPGLNQLRSQRSSIDQRLALVRESKRAAEDELTSLTGNHVTQLIAALQQATPSNPPSSREADAVSAESLRLRSEWQQLLIERSELARTKTDEHPQVKDIDQRLAETKKRIDALSARDAARQGKPQPRPNQLETLQDAFRRRSLELSETVATARRREEELLSEAARLAITPAAIPLSTVVVEQPEVVERQGGQPSGMQLGVLVLVAIAAGGLTYRLLREISAQHKLGSAAEIQSHLDLPVIELAAPQHVPPARHIGRMVRRSLLTAEIGLLILACSTALLVALQPHLTRPVAVDPIGAVAESLDRTFSPTFRR